MNDNVKKVIERCKNEGEEKVCIILKPGVDNIKPVVAYIYSAGVELCHFNWPDGKGFHIWNKENERFSYGEFEFKSGKGFDYLFANWDNMIKACYNRAHDADNFKIGKVSGKKPINHYKKI